MAIVRFKPITAAIDAFLSLTDETGRINRSQLKTWANEIVRKLTFEDQLTNGIVLLDVEDYLVDLPSDFHSIVQVAYKEVEEEETCIDDIINYNSSLEIDTKSNKGFTLRQDVPGLILAQMKHFYRYVSLNNNSASIYYPEFRLIKYARSTMHGADYHIKGCLNLDSQLGSNNSVAYVVEGVGDKLYLRLNVKSGQVLLSYLKFNVDEEGYRYIPDIEDVFDTIKWYLEERVSYQLGRKYIRTDLNLSNTYFLLSSKAKTERERAQGRARDKLRTLDFQNFWSFIENNYQKIVHYDEWQQVFNATKRDRYGEDMDRFTNHE